MIMLKTLKNIKLYILVTFLCSAGNAYSNTTNWDFEVSLNGDEIGYHKFTVIEKEDSKKIYTTARFEVKFLFFTAYTYSHDNVETWSNNCLETIQAITDDNGDLLNVDGYKINNGTNIKTKGEEKKYPECIQTFAYWDMSFLKEKQLLNSQTGELVEISSELIGKEQIKSRGKNITADHYRITGKDLLIDLWYSNTNDWLALESITADGHLIKYIQN